ncbi:immunoglobulin domain-containing protein [Opitutus sp. ER46]|uniref:immunoglobulin domain-containing protein n=1 Tax=Opitutus sp. ER46 TaxID=2161864 RepID=UPI000D2FBD84|nr:immunoglobulin domain-containing protein [Opitutus sp. ER46]PTX91566.1 hypothetical protein DB354_16965 [Opitutus sp. ER46]
MYARRFLLLAAFLFGSALYGQYAIDPTVIPSDNGTGPAATAPSLQGISGGGTVENGQLVNLTVLFYGDGAGQTYQWKKNGVELAGATAVSYRIEAAVAADAGTYGVTVTNSAGASVATTSLVVRALAAPTISSQPYSNSVYVGQNASFYITANGSYPRTYQWRRDGTAIAGATTSVLSLTAVTLADAAGYSVVVSNSQGSATSQTATLTVNAAVAPVLYPSYPNDQTVMVGNSVSFGYSLNAGSSPFAIQWYKNGTAIPGATTTPLLINNIALADAGNYSVKVSNAAGSATSREAVLTVNPATPVTIYTQPEGVTVAEGQSFQLSAYASGSSPLTYQWEKDGTPIKDAKYSYYSVSAAAFADAGAYRVAVTNPAGTVYSSAATVTVNAAQAPTITRQPASVTVPYAGTLDLSVGVAGTPPLTIQWSKDGVVIPNAVDANYHLYEAKPTHSGSYTVVVKNRVGSITSNAAVVKVSEPVAPTITEQPKPARVALGQNASFSAYWSSTGAGPVKVQWRKNGVPLAGATYSSYSISAVKESDAGVYSLQATGPGGTATSNDASLTVLPPEPPKVSYWPSDTSVSLGNSLYLGGMSVYGSPPFTYQWYRNGVALAGATSAYYRVDNVTAADLGTYVVRVTGPGGILISREIRVALNESNTTPWVSVAQLGEVVYFLATEPSRIERYDLAAEKWLPSVVLSATQVPTAFLPTTEGVYVAYGRTLARRSPSLVDETPVLNAGADITQLYAHGDFLYYLSGAPNYSPTLQSVRRSNLQPGPTVAAMHKVVFSQLTNRGYGLTSNEASRPAAFTISSDGSFTDVTTASYDAYDSYSIKRLHLVAGGSELVTTNGSRFATPSLAYTGSLGLPFLDLVSRSDGATVVLRAGMAHLLRAGDYAETARAPLSFAATRAFGRGTDVFVFGANAGTLPFAVAKLAPAAFVAPIPRPVTTGQGERMSLDGVAFGDGVVQIVSRTKQAVVRWSTSTRSYLSAVPLRGSPRLVTSNPKGTRTLLQYEDGTLTAVPLTLSTPTETAVAVHPYSFGSVMDIERLLVCSTGYNRMGFDANGQFVFSTSYESSGLGLYWNAALRRLYSVSRYSSGFQYEATTAEGIPGYAVAGSTDATMPLCPNAEGTLMATGNGRVLSADLKPLGALANNILDGAWLGNRLYSLRVGTAGTAQVQRWSEVTYLLDGTVDLPGTPLRVFAISDKQLVVVTSVQGFPSFTVLNADLTVSNLGAGAEAFAGVYLAKLGTGGAGGDLALLVRANGSAVLVGNVLGTNEGGLLCENVTLGRDGTFIANALDPRTSAGRLVSGVINVDGTLSGSVYPLELTFTGSRPTGSGGLAGYYVVPPLNGALGGSYGIVAPDGRAVFFAYSGNTSAGGLGTFANGQMTLTPASGAQLTVTIDGGGSVRVIADKTGFSGQKFGGLRDGVRQAMRLFNISSRGRTGDGLNTLVAGFVISGSANRNVLIRAVGPTLSKLSVKEPIADPKLSLYQGSTLLKEVDNWSSEANAADIAAAAKRTQAFELPNPSKDAALYVNLPPAIYTVMVTPAAGSHGVALVEVYDGDDLTGTDQPHLANISTRGWVGTGEDVLVAGVVVSGNTPKRVLIRGIGPRLTDLGVNQGALADPILTLRDSEKVIATNDNWGTQTSGLSADEITVRSMPTGAFGLLPGSKDAVLLLTLEPGLYTAILSGKGDTTGTGMIEVYEVN